MSIGQNLISFKQQIPPAVTLVAVSKTHPVETIMEAYQEGQRDFGENKVQELLPKYETMPKDIRWHLIGHLQTNKVKFIAPFIHLIQSVDSEKLLAEIDKQAKKCNRVIDVLLQIFIAKEETKSGFSFDEAEELLKSDPQKKYQNVRIIGLMGMATNTENKDQVRNEFHSLLGIYRKFSTLHSPFSILSMGMSSDWKIATGEGSTMIRVGSTIFGQRNYSSI